MIELILRWNCLISGLMLVASGVFTIATQIYQYRKKGGDK